jgi:hypothetical protein
MLTGNRTKKSLGIALSCVGRGLRGRGDGGGVTNVQYKHDWNCHYESLPCNEYFLIKKIIKKQKVGMWKGVK